MNDVYINPNNMIVKKHGCMHKFITLDKHTIIKRYILFKRLFRN